MSRLCSLELQRVSKESKFTTKMKIDNKGSLILIFQLFLAQCLIYISILVQHDVMKSAVHIYCKYAYARNEEVEVKRKAIAMDYRLTDISADTTTYCKYFLIGFQFFYCVIIKR